MEPKFKSSFIPKQPMGQSTGTATKVPKRAHTGPSFGGIGTMFCFILFVLALGTSGGLFLYTSYLDDAVNQKIDMLERAREAFQPALIKTLVRLDQRIIAAEDILEHHTAPSNLFALLENTVLPSVQLTFYTYEQRADGSVAVAMRGVTNSLPLLALQADVFGNNTFFIDPVISELTVQSGGDAAGNDSVVFEVSAGVDPRLASFTETFAAGTNDAQ